MNREEQRRTRRIQLSRWIDSMAPPGIGTDWKLSWYFIGLVLVFLPSLRFIGNYNDAFSELYQWEFDKQVLIKGVVMKDFVTVLGDSLQSFFLYCLVLLGAVAWHYIYYHYKTKSIYLMKRLPNRFELHKRAWTLPLVGIVVTLFVAFVLLVIYFEIYMLVTPKQCIAPGQWSKIWR